MIAGDAASAFEAASGISADAISLLLRTILLAVTFLWAGWCVYGEVLRLRHHKLEEAEFVSKIFRALLVVTFMTVLVFI